RAWEQSAETWGARRCRGSPCWRSAHETWQPGNAFHASPVGAALGREWSRQPSRPRAAHTGNFKIASEQRVTLNCKDSPMALISMRQLLDHAAEYGYGVPAFNVNNLEQTRAIMEAAQATDSPVIMQASAGARKYAGAPFLRHLILAAIEEFPHIPVCMHQDH